MVQRAHRAVDRREVCDASIGEKGFAVRCNDTGDHRLHGVRLNERVGEFRKIQTNGYPDHGIDLGLCDDSLGATVQMLALGLTGHLDGISKGRERRNDRAQRPKLVLQCRKRNADLVTMIGGDNAGPAGQRENRRPRAADAPPAVA